jgi:hypothetical protein
MDWSDATGNAPATLKDLEVVFYNVVAVIMAAAGIVFFIMLVMGGFKFMTAGGDPKNLESAKGTLTNAVAGLVLVALSYLILVTISYFTGSQITNFRITPP